MTTENYIMLMKRNSETMRHIREGLIVLKGGNDIGQKYSERSDAKVVMIRDRNASVVVALCNLGLTTLYKKCVPY